MDERAAAKLRTIPQLQRLLEAPEAAPLVKQFSHAAVTAQLRRVLAGARTDLLEPGGPEAAPSTAELLTRVEAALAASRVPGLRRVNNATGVILHTNLGRAPLAQEAAAAAAAAAVAHGYCNVELDLETGARGLRTGIIETLLRELIGAEAAIAVNNNAAGMLLALSALAAGGEVLVSRGELVEIGGGFRIPDVIRHGGARLVEVGTTNKTRIDDYRRAITPATRVLLKVHQSNFQIVGFTETTTVPALATLAREAGLLLVDDLGSGNKLMGGPQAGLLAGRAAAIDRLRTHPMLRAVRLDKLSLAALEATLRLYHERGPSALPVLQAIGQSEAMLRDRAERLANLLGPFAAVRSTTGRAGGGALPGQKIASQGVTLGIPEQPPERLAKLLRMHRPAVVGRVLDGSLLLDMLAVADDEVPEVAAAVRLAMTA